MVFTDEDVWAIHTLDITYRKALLKEVGNGARYSGKTCVPKILKAYV